MPKIESEKIDCLHRPCSRPAPRGKIELVCTQSEVIEQFDSFSLLKLLFPVRNWHCWSRKAFSCQMTPQSWEKTAKTAVFRHRWQAWKGVWSIAAVHQRPRSPWDWQCSFAFSSLSFDISIKNSAQRWSSDFQGLFRVKIRKMAQGSNDLSTLPLKGIKPARREGRNLVNTHWHRLFCLNSSFRLESSSLPQETEWQANNRRKINVQVNCEANVYLSPMVGLPLSFPRNAWWFRCETSSSNKTAGVGECLLDLTLLQVALWRCCPASSRVILKKTLSCFEKKLKCERVTAICSGGENQAEEIWVGPGGDRTHRLRSHFSLVCTT